MLLVLQALSAAPACSGVRPGRPPEEKDVKNPLSSYDQQDPGSDNPHRDGSCPTEMGVVITSTPWHSQDSCLGFFVDVQTRRHVKVTSFFGYEAPRKWKVGFLGLEHTHQGRTQNGTILGRFWCRTPEGQGRMTQ